VQYAYTYHSSCNWRNEPRLITHMWIGTFANEIILFILHSEQHEPARRNKEGDPSLHLHVVIEHVFPQRSKQMLFFPFESGHVAAQMHVGGRFYLP